MTRREREPAPLADLLPKLVAGRGWQNHMALDRLRADWAGIVGEQIARRSEPVSLDGGVLVVRAEPGAWATELTLLASALAERACQELGPGAVREVVVRAAGKGPQASPRGPSDGPARAPGKGRAGGRAGTSRWGRSRPPGEPR